MARRWTKNMHGERFLADVRRKKVHDLDHEDVTPGGCGIDEITAAEDDSPFDSLQAAGEQGYEPCDKCV